MSEDVSRASASSTDWRRLEEKLEAIVTDSRVMFEPATVANAREFLGLVRDKCPVPEIAKGYWSTICFFWPGLEFEVFSEHVEIYRFFDGRTDIEHHSRNPGEPFSPDVIAALPG